MITATVLEIIIITKKLACYLPKSTCIKVSGNNFKIKISNVNVYPHIVNVSRELNGFKELLDYIKGTIHLQ